MLVIKKFNLCLVLLLVFMILLLLRALYSRAARKGKTFLPSPVTCYTDNDPPRFLILVTSLEEDNKARYIFREGPMQQDWFSCSGSQVDVSWKFSLQNIATLHGSYLPYSLQLESDTNNDIIDTKHFRNPQAGMSGAHGLLGLDIILQQYDWDFLVKITDRTVLDVSKLLDYLPPLATHQAPYYGGLVTRAGSAVYVREELTILSRLALHNMLAAGHFVSASAGKYNEAVRLGRIAELLQIKPHAIAGGYNVTKFSVQPDVCKNAVFLTNAGLDTLRMAYTARASGPEFC